MAIKHLFLLACITWCLAIEQVEVDDFCRFLSSKDRNSPSKVEFVRPKKWIQGYVGQYKMKATQPIAEGEIVYTYSLRDDTINVENAKQDPILGISLLLPSNSKGTLFTDLQSNQNKTQDDFVLYDDQIIKLYLLHLKTRSESNWTPYLKALPAEVDIPLNWSDSELAELEGTMLHSTKRPSFILLTLGFTQKLRDSLKRDFDSFETILKEKYPEQFAFLDYEAWKWASSIYNGRLWFKSKVFNPVLPLMEVFNLKESPSVKVQVDIETQMLNLIATEDIEQGEEIFISDGKLSNSDLLDYYGFVLPKNTEDAVEFGVGLNREDKLFGNKVQLLKQRKLENGKSYKIRYTHIPDDFVYALRIYHLTVYDFEDVKNALENKVVSLQNELLVAESIIDTSRQYLAKFTTTLKEDKTLLERKDLSKRLKNAIILRRSEKRILARTLKTAKAILKDVKSKWDLRSMDVPGTDDFNNNLNIKEIM